MSVVVGIWGGDTSLVLQDRRLGVSDGISYGVPGFHMPRSRVYKVLIPVFVAGPNKHDYLRLIIGVAEIQQ